MKEPIKSIHYVSTCDLNQEQVYNPQAAFLRRIGEEGGKEGGGKMGTVKGIPTGIPSPGAVAEY